MKTFHVVATAALLLTSTAAYAGNSISFEIEGQKIHIEAPKGCNTLSCLQITAPSIANKSFNLNSFNLDGLKSKNSDDDSDVATATPAQGVPQPAPAPQAVARRPQPPTAVATVAPPPLRRRPRLLQRRNQRPPPPQHLFRRRHLRLHPPQRRRPRPSACGRPRRTRAMCGSSSAVLVFAAMPWVAARRSSST